MIALYTFLPSLELADHRIRADLEARRQIPKTRNIFKISIHIYVYIYIYKYRFLYIMDMI